MSTQPKWQIWTGRVLTALPILMFALSATMKLTRAPAMVEIFENKFGFSPTSLLPIAAVEVLVTIVYAIPRTAVLGGILIAAYLGGAVVTHARVGEPFVIPIVLGIIAWGGLYLRDERVRAILPFRSSTTR